MSQTADLCLHLVLVLHLQLDPLDGRTFGKGVTPFRQTRTTVLADEDQIAGLQGHGDTRKGDVNPQLLREDRGRVGVADTRFESGGEELARLVDRDLGEPGCRRKDGDHIQGESVGEQHFVFLSKNVYLIKRNCFITGYIIAYR